MSHRPRAAAIHDQRRLSTFSTSARALLYSFALLVPQPGIYSILYTLCLGALKVFEELPLRFFFDFFPDLQGYGLHTLWHIKLFWYIILCTHAHLHTHPFLILQIPF